MEEKKRIHIDVEEELSKEVEEWADFLGIDVYGDSPDSTYAQQLNDHIAKKMEALQKETYENGVEKNEDNNKMD